MTTNRSDVLASELAIELFLVPDEVSAELRVSRGDLKRLRDARLGPAYFTIGSTIRYLQADVDQWRADHPIGIEIPRRRALRADR